MKNTSRCGPADSVVLIHIPRSFPRSPCLAGFCWKCFQTHHADEAKAITAAKEAAKAQRDEEDGVLAKWDFEVGGMWQSMQDGVVKLLEASRKKDAAIVSFQNKGLHPPTSFRVDMKEMTQKNLRSNEHQRIRRRPPLVAGTLLTHTEHAKKRERDEEREAKEKAEAEKAEEKAARDKKIADQTHCGHPECKKRLKLSDLPCRCNLRFCALHRCPEAHFCVFDYRTDGKRVLEKMNKGGGEFDKMGNDRL